MGEILATQWFYAIGDERFGPVTGSELKVLARTGVLHPADLVFKEGMPDWQPARKVKSLWVSRRSVADTSGVASKPPPVRPPEAVAAAPALQPKSEPAPRSEPQPAPQPTASVAAEAPWLVEAPRQPGFSEALSGAFAHAGKAAALLIRRPLQLTFFTMTLLVLFASSLAGVITAPLFPLFLMGYLTVLKQIVQGEQPSLAAFLAFTRHGVSCLWHLLMLLAAYLVTLAGIASVLIVLGMAFFFVAGTIMLGVNTVLSVGSAAPAVAPQIIVRNHEGTATPLVLTQLGEIHVDGNGGFTAPARNSLASSAAGMMQVLMVLVITTLSVTGFTALQIVFSYLALDVASKNPHLHGAGFVYEAYVETLAMFGRRWVEIMLCALLASAAVLVSNVLLMGLAWMFSMVSLTPLSIWVMTIAAPLLQLALGLFLLVFQATTCLSLREREAAFVR